MQQLQPCHHHKQNAVASSHGFHPLEAIRRKRPASQHAPCIQSTNTFNNPQRYHSCRKIADIPWQPNPSHMQQLQPYHHHKEKAVASSHGFQPLQAIRRKNGLKSQLSAALEPLKDLLIFFFFFFRLLTDTSLGCAKLRCLDSGASGTARAAPQQLGYLSKPICTMAPLTPTLIPRTHPPNAGSLDEAAREHTGRLDATKENSKKAPWLAHFHSTPLPLRCHAPLSAPTHQA